MYLPTGTWHNLWTGAAYEGRKTVEIDSPLDRITVFVRSGAAIPVRLSGHGELGEAVPFGIEATGYWTVESNDH